MRVLNPHYTGLHMHVPWTPVVGSMVEPAENFHRAKRGLAESSRSRQYRLEEGKGYGNSMTSGLNSPHPSTQPH